jgi:hypothetical protein
LNLGWLAVRELPTNGFAYISSSAWPTSDLNTVFPTSESVVFSPNTITNTGTVWYNPASGGVGSEGQKMMGAYLYGASKKGALSGQSLAFEGFVSNFSLATNIAGTPYSLSAFIQDFTPDYSSRIQTFIPITSTGGFSVSQSLVDDPLRNVQWGLFMIGPNIWAEDSEQLAVAGSVTVVPEPSTYALLGLATLGGLIALRLRRKA